MTFRFSAFPDLKRKDLFYLRLSDGSEELIPDTRQSFIHSLFYVFDAFGRIKFISLLSAGGPNLFKVGNNKVASEKREKKERKDQKTIKTKHYLLIEIEL